MDSSALLYEDAPHSVPAASSLACTRWHWLEPVRSVCQQADQPLNNLMKAV